MRLTSVVLCFVTFLAGQSNGQQLWMPFLRSHLGDLFAAFKPIENLNLGGIGGGLRGIPEDNNQGRYSSVGGYGKPTEVVIKPIIMATTYSIPSTASPTTAMTPLPTLPSTTTTQTSTTSTTTATTTTTTPVPTTTTTTTVVPITTAVPRRPGPFVPSTTTTKGAPSPPQRPGPVVPAATTRRTVPPTTATTTRRQTPSTSRLTTRLRTSTTRRSPQRPGPVMPSLPPRRPGPVMLTNMPISTSRTRAPVQRPRPPGPVVGPVPQMPRPNPVQTNQIPGVRPKPGPVVGQPLRPMTTVNLPKTTKVPVRQPGPVVLPVLPQRPGPVVPSMTTRRMSPITTRRTTAVRTTATTTRRPQKPGPVAPSVTSQRLVGPVVPVNEQPQPQRPGLVVPQRPGPMVPQRPGPMVPQRPGPMVPQTRRRSPSSNIHLQRPGPVATAAAINRPISVPSNSGIYTRAVRRPTRVQRQKYNRSNTVHLRSDRDRLPLITLQGASGVFSAPSPTQRQTNIRQKAVSRPVSRPKLQPGAEKYFPKTPRYVNATPNPVMQNRRTVTPRSIRPTSIVNVNESQRHPSFQQLCGAGQTICSLKMKSFDTEYPIIRYALTHSTRLSGAVKQVHDRTGSLALPPPLKARDSLAPETAQLMMNLLQIAKPQKSLCIGVFTGVGVMAAAYASGIGTTVIGLEEPANEKYWQMIGRRFVDNESRNHARIDVRSRVSIRQSLEMLRTVDPATFDFVLLDDSNMANYHREYELALSLLRPGGFMMITDVYVNGDAVLAARGNSQSTSHIDAELPADIVNTLTRTIATDTRVRATFLPFAGGTMLVVKQ